MPRQEAGWKEPTALGARPQKALARSRPGFLLGSRLRGSAGCKRSGESRSACGLQPPGEFPASPEPGLPPFPSLLHWLLPLSSVILRQPPPSKRQHACFKYIKRCNKLHKGENQNSHYRRIATPRMDITQVYSILQVYAVRGKR